MTIGCLEIWASLDIYRLVLSICAKSNHIAVDKVESADADLHARLKIRAEAHRQPAVGIGEYTRLVMILSHTLHKIRYGRRHWDGYMTFV